MCLPRLPMKQMIYFFVGGQVCELCCDVFITARVKTVTLFFLHFSLFFFLSSPSSRAQTCEAYSPAWAMEKDLALVIGYNGWQHHYAEIGLSVHKYGVGTHHPIGHGWSVTSEMRVHENFIMAPKLSAWVGGGVGALAMKINTLYYTNFKTGRIALRPEIGIGGFGYFTVVYGFNFYLNKQDILGLTRHVFSITVPVKIKKLKTEGYRG